MGFRSGQWLLTAAFTIGAAFGQGTEAPAPQTSPSPSPAAPAPPATPSPWTRGGVDFYLLGDVYYDLNFNHPASGYNQLYNFNVTANQAHLNMAKFSMEKASGLLGFRVDVGAGRAFDIISSTDPGPEGMKYLEQAYLEFRPSHMHGIQLDFGKFVTSAGAEVIETNANWNYSRSLLFAWAIPYYHLGLRATIPVTKTFSAGVQVVNGWNNVKDNNDGKTVGLVGNFSWKKVSWSNTYYAGPEHDHTTQGYRQLYDTNVVITPSERLSTYLNFDYGTDKNIGPGRQNWTGLAAAARYQLSKRFSIAPRAEIFSDSDGFNTGTKQTLKEFTLTGEMKLRDGLFSRLEFRRDNSDRSFFDRGSDLAVAHAQTTMTLGLIAFFGPKK